MQEGAEVGLKTSTAFVPPELAALVFKPKESIEELREKLPELERQKAQAAKARWSI